MKKNTITEVQWPVFTEHSPVPPAKGILSCIGVTPMLVPHCVWPEGSLVRLLAKAEWVNSSGSVKARPALWMILEAERRGELHPGQIIIDATSGNTGLAYAMIGAARGYQVELVMPANVSLERKRLAKIYGATVVESDPAKGIDGAIRLVQERVAAEQERYFHPDQYSNPANWLAHYHTTGLEIWEQTRGQVTHFVAGIGTGGTLMGVGRRLRELNPAVRIIAVQPAAATENIPGLKHMPSSLVPAIYDPDFADEIMPVTAKDARCLALRVAREEGWFIGFSAGAAMFAAREVAKRLTSGVVVTLLPDDGSKYLSAGLCNE